MARYASNRPDMSTLTTLLTGVAFGAVSAAVFRARFEHEQERRNRLGDAAAELSAKLSGASNAVRHALDILENSPNDIGVKPAVDDANHLANEAVVPLARVQLLFSRHPPIQTAGANAFEKLRAAAAALRDGPGNAKTARTLYDEARGQLDKFTDDASKVLQQSFWRAA
jgi:hypothetical protein